MPNTKPPSRGLPEPDLEESTKVHSSADIDEILRQARGGAEPAGHGFDPDEHTRIGPSHELAMQSMAVPDIAEATPVPRPANVIRRSSPSIQAVRTSGPIPIVEARGSQDVRIPTSPPAVDDDAAFAAWDAYDAPATPAPAAAPMPPPLPAPPRAPGVAASYPTSFDAPEFDGIGVRVAMPAVAPAVAPARRIGPLLWGLTLALAFAGGAYAYRTIATLEQRATRAERASAAATRDAAAARDEATVAARKADDARRELVRVRAALDAAETELAKAAAAPRR